MGFNDIGKVLYRCDPEKNIRCPKTSCCTKGGPCSCTENLDFAKEPIEKVILELDREGKFCERTIRT